MLFDADAFAVCANEHGSDVRIHVRIPQISAIRYQEMSALLWSADLLHPVCRRMWHVRLVHTTSSQY